MPGRPLSSLTPLAGHIVRLQWRAPGGGLQTATGKLHIATPFIHVHPRMASPRRGKKPERRTEGNYYAVDPATIDSVVRIGQ